MLAFRPAWPICTPNLVPWLWAKSTISFRGPMWPSSWWIGRFDRSEQLSSSSEQPMHNMIWVSRRARIGSLPILIARQKHSPRAPDPEARFGLPVTPRSPPSTPGRPREQRNCRGGCGAISSCTHPLPSTYTIRPMSKPAHL